jgi:hypothetical protein
VATHEVAGLAQRANMININAQERHE